MAVPAFRAGSTITPNNVGNLSFTMPTGTVQNDIIIVVLHIESAGVTVTAPAGFTQKFQDTYSGASREFEAFVYWKRAGSGEAGPYNFSWAGTPWVDAYCFSVSGCTTSGDPFGADTDGFMQPKSILEATTPGILSETDAFIVLIGQQFDSDDWSIPATHNTNQPQPNACGWAEMDSAYPGLTERYDNFNIMVATGTSATGGGMQFGIAPASGSNRTIGRLFALRSSTSAAYTLPTLIDASPNVRIGIAGTTSVICDMPWNVQADDILIVFFGGKHNVGFDTGSMPTGWTAFGNVNAGTLLNTHMAWKRADGTESNTAVTFTLTSAPGLTYGLFSACFRNCLSTADPIDNPVSEADSSADTTCGFPTWTPAAVDTLPVWFAMIGDDGLPALTQNMGGTPAAQMRRAQATTSGTDWTSALWVGRTCVTSVAAIGTRSATMATSETSIGWTFGLKPEPAGGGAAELEAALSGSASVSAPLTTAIPLAASLSGSATVAAPFTTAIRFAAALAGSGVATAALTTAITMAASFAGAATVSPELTTAIPLEASVSASASTSADLSTSIALAAAASGAASTSADLTTAIRFASDLAGSGAIAGALAENAAELEAALTAAGSIAGDLSTQIQFASALTGAGSITGDITTAIPLASAVAGGASTSADFSTAIALAAAVTGAATTESELEGNAAALEAALSGSATLTVGRLDTPYHLFGTGDPGGTRGFESGFALTTGVVFRSAYGGQVLGLRFWKPGLTTGTHTGHLWAFDGTLLASATFTHASSFEGWSEVRFASPVAIDPDTHYVAGVYFPDSGYYFTGDYFVTARVDGPLTAPASADVTGGNGRYIYSGSAAFPNQTFNENNFWVTPLVDAIPLAASVSGAASVTADLTTAVSLEAALSGAASQTSALTTAIALDADLSGSGSIAGEFEGEGAALVAALDATGSLTGDLTTAIRLEAAVSGAGSATADLTTAIELAASLTGAGATTAAFTTAIRFAAALDGAGTFVGGLQGNQAEFAANLSGSGSFASADLQTAIALAVGLTGSGSATASLTTAIRMAAALEAAGVVVAPLTTAKPIEAALSGSSSTTSALTTAIALAAAFDANGQATADLTTAIRLQAALSADATVSALLTETARFAVIQVVNESTNRYRVQAEQGRCPAVVGEVSQIGSGGVQAESSGRGGVTNELAQAPGISAEDVP
jgi:hypothetical protein